MHFRHPSELVKREEEAFYVLESRASACRMFEGKIENEETLVEVGENRMTEKKNRNRAQRTLHRALCCNIVCTLGQKRLCKLTQQWLTENVPSS